VLSPDAGAAPADGGTVAYEDVFYDSGGLRIEAYLYKPAGSGPFPAVVYNHGSRAGNERTSVPFTYVGRILTEAGFVVLVPERRGYGRSDGTTFSDAVGDGGVGFVDRLQQETDDVLASLEYLRTVPEVDISRLGVMGWSLGGIVSLFSASRSDAFRAAVDQAGGSLSWRGSADLRSAMVDAATKVRIPVLAMGAQNDATVDAVLTVAGTLQDGGVPHKLVLYEPFQPSQATTVAPGHAIFSAEGAPIWRGDVTDFLRRHL
jgi:dienelactone hydrolase